MMVVFKILMRKLLTFLYQNNLSQT